MRIETWVVQSGNLMKIFDTEGQARRWVAEHLMGFRRESAAIWNMMDKPCRTKQSS